MPEEAKYRRVASVTIDIYDQRLPSNVVSGKKPTKDEAMQLDVIVANADDGQRRATFESIDQLIEGIQAMFPFCNIRITDNWRGEFTVNAI